MIGEWWIGKDQEGGNSDLFQVLFQYLPGENAGTMQNLGIIVTTAKIRIKDLTPFPSNKS